MHVAKESMMKSKGSSLSGSLSERQATCLSFGIYSFDLISPHPAAEPPWYSIYSAFSTMNVAFLFPATPLFVFRSQNRFSPTSAQSSLFCKDRVKISTNHCPKMTFPSLNSTEFLLLILSVELLVCAWNMSCSC